MQTNTIVLAALALIGVGGFGVIGWGFWQEVCIIAGSGLLKIVIGGAITSVAGIAIPIAYRILHV